MATNNETINLKIQVDASQAQQSTVNYRAKIKELKDQMAELSETTDGLANATEEQKQAYIDAAVEAARMKDALGDINRQIEVLSDDYLYFNTTLDALKGGTAVVQGLVGTMDLLGISNTGVEQVVKTMVSLQGIMNSLNAVQQLFNKDSRVRIVLQKLLSTEVKKTAVAETGGAVASVAFAKGEDVATKASVKLALGCKAVGTAIKNIPVIGWILAAIAALVSLTQLVAGLLDDGDEGLEQQRQANEQVEQQQKHYEEVDSKIIKCKDDFEKWNGILTTANKDSQTYKDTLKQLENELGVSLQNSQIDTKTLNKLEAIHLEVKQAQLEAEFEQNQYLADRNKLQQINNVLNAAATLNHKERAAYIQDQLGVDEKMAAQYAAAIHHAADEHRYISDQLALEGNAASKVYTDLNNRIDEHSAKQKKLSDNVIAAVDKQDKFIEEAGLKRINTDNKVTNAHNENTENIEEEQKKHLENLDKANKDAAEKINGYWKTSNSDIEKENEKTYEGRIDNLGREYAKTIDTLDKEYSEYETYYNSLSEKDKKALGDKLVTLEQFAAAQKEVRDKALENYVNGVKKEDAAEAQRQKEKNREKIDNQNELDSELLNARLQNLTEGSEEYYELQCKIEEERFEQEMENLRRRLEDKQLTQAEYDQLAAEAWRNHQQNLTAIQDEEDKKRLEMTQNRLSAVGSMFANMSDFVTTLMDMELEEAEGNEKKQKEIKKKYATAQALMKIGQIGIDTALGIMGVWSQVMELGPIAGPILGTVLSATIGALGIANTAKAIQEKNKIMKASRGAYVVGASHTAGGVNMELEGGEMVLNKNVAKVPQFRAIASAMNVATGGVALGGGGVANQTQSFGITKEDVQSIVAETVAGIAAIPVVVSAQTISETQRRVNVTTQRSQI